jgi:hypothetical protein
VAEPASLLMLEFLGWISSRPRTYAEAMEAWRSSCPRHTVWEDALADGLIEMREGDAPRQLVVALTRRGRAALDGGRGGEGAGPRPAAPGA